MRCPDCNKFVSNEQAKPEVNSIEIDEDGNITASVRIVNVCAECGTELTEAELDIDTCMNDPSVLEGHSGDGHDLTIEECGTESTCRTEGKGRGTKTFYGASVSYHVTCSCEKLEECCGDVSDEVQASSMDQCF